RRSSTKASRRDGRGKLGRALTTRTRHVEQRARPPQTLAGGTLAAIPSTMQHPCLPIGWWGGAIGVFWSGVCGVCRRTGGRLSVSGLTPQCCHVGSAKARGRTNGMMRYVAFVVLGCAFVSSLWVTVQTHRLYEQTESVTESAIVTTGAIR